MAIEEKKKKPTVKTIAELAGVSTTTVSLALSNKKTRIPESTCQKILAIAKELNYKPSLIAQSLATNKTNILGVIIPNFSDQIFTELATGIEKYARDRNYNILICNSDNDMKNFISQIALLEAHRVEGMMVIPPASINTDETQLKEVIGALNNSTVPFVLLDKAVHSLFHDYVSSDNIYGGYLAANYLYQMGHTKVGIISGPKTEYGSIKRLRGFTDFFKENNIEIDPDNIYESDYTLQGGYMAALELLCKKVTAIFALNDMMAIGAYKAAFDLKIKIPKDVSIIGYDDNPSAELVNPPLTTIHQPFLTMGAKACEILLKRIEKPDRNHQDYYFMPELIPRQSVRKI